jgi:hypothetical protein
VRVRRYAHRYFTAALNLYRSLGSMCTGYGGLDLTSEPPTAATGSSSLLPTPQAHESRGQTCPSAADGKDARSTVRCGMCRTTANADGLQRQRRRDRDLLAGPQSTATTQPRDAAQCCRTTPPDPTAQMWLLGNGVVPQQATAVFRALRAELCADVSRRRTS